MLLTTDLVDGWRVISPRQRRYIAGRHLDRVVAARVDYGGGQLRNDAHARLLVRLVSGDVYAVPLSSLSPTYDGMPDPDALRVTDYGRTVMLGKYKVSCCLIAEAGSVVQCPGPAQ